MEHKSNQKNLKSNLIQRFLNLINFISSSKILSKLIFNIVLLPSPYHKFQNWDFTTLILKIVLNKHIKDNQKVLEIGTGHLGILSIYIAKKKCVNVTATDINPAFIENAKKNARENRLSINFIQSDLFSHINEKFDVIFFNPPYVPKEWILNNRKTLYTNSIFDLVWNGGVDGYETIKRFLNDVSNVMYEDSKILLGVNTYFIDILKMRKIIQENNLELISMTSRFWTMSKVFILRKKI